MKEGKKAQNKTTLPNNKYLGGEKTTWSIADERRSDK